MMSKLMLTMIPLLPLLLAMGYAWRPAGAWLVAAPTAALAGALWVPVDSAVSLPWLLLGVHWQLDPVGQTFLLFSALAWLIVSLFVAADSRSYIRARHYGVLFLSALAGNLLLIVAADLISFYIGFAMMGLSAYGLLLKPSQRARRAARVYLGFTLAGELALFLALLLLALNADSLLIADLHASAVPDLAIGLLLIGFGIKVALPGLHPWLPLAYSSAPLISVAVLSGPMMKAGLLGWLRFMPRDQPGLGAWGELLIALGFGGLLLGTILALLQRRPSAILAYSSVAKMGLISLLFGYALANPQAAPQVLGALVLFAMHHLMTKTALFIGLHQLQAENTGRWTYPGMVLLALGMAGLPLGGGLAAKTALGQATGADLANLLLFAGFAGALMMLHFVYRVHQERITRNTQAKTTGHWQMAAHGAWWALLPLAFWAPFAPIAGGFDFKALLIILAAGALLWLSHRLIQPGELPRLFRPGDVYHLLYRIRLRPPLQLAPRVNASVRPPVLKLSSLVPGEGSLLLPGLAWLIVTFLLLGVMFAPIF
jgi:formate hydrogenlyase subunit 3/multisubunit Na+/H+ antiporter MnhD subunit